MKKSKFFLIFLILVLGCQIEDNSIQFVDAYSELNKAIEYKYKECGNKPEEILLPPKSLSRDSLKICTLSILRVSCPFTEYPIFCYEMYWQVITK
ncbi:MAG: hypothetical protein ACK4UJ_05585 [Leptonema sp. (in: bacteria)]